MAPKQTLAKNTKVPQVNCLKIATRRETLAAHKEPSYTNKHGDCVSVRRLCAKAGWFDLTSVQFRNVLFLVGYVQQTDNLICIGTKSELVQQECERQKCERHQCEANSANANRAKELWRFVSVAGHKIRLQIETLKKDRAILSETSGQRKLVCWCWGRAKRLTWPSKNPKNQKNPCSLTLFRDYTTRNQQRFVLTRRKRYEIERASVRMKKRESVHEKWEMSKVSTVYAGRGYKSNRNMALIKSTWEQEYATPHIGVWHGGISSNVTSEATRRHIFGKKCTSTLWVSKDHPVHEKQVIMQEKAQPCASLWRKTLRPKRVRFLAIDAPIDDHVCLPLYHRTFYPYAISLRVFVKKKERKSATKGFWFHR